MGWAGELDADGMEIDKMWKDYRKVTGELTWRLATPADSPAIKRLRNVSERFLGRTQRDPCLFASPVILAFVAENKKGKVVEVVYCEAVVEVVKMSCSATGFEESAALEEDLVQWLRTRGFRKVILSVAHHMKYRMAPILNYLGFRCIDPSFSSWARRL